MTSTKSNGRLIFTIVFGLMLMLGLGVTTFAQFTVTTNLDEPNSSGTLRQAIEFANNRPGTTIRFNLPANLRENGVYRLRLSRQLPAITASRTIIDGVSQREWDGAPVILLDGSNAGTSNGLIILGASDCMIRQLIINGFLRNGIVVMGSSSHVEGGAPTEIVITPAMRNRIIGCFIGTDATGEVAAPNRWTGITITNGASSNVIGGRLTAERNIISGNGQDGVFISSSPGFDGSLVSGNLVQGNFIGTNKGGSAVLRGGGNSGNGVSVWSGNRLGEPRGPQLNTISGNLISGNQQSGVLISGRNVLQNVVRSNLIGTSLSGESVPNGRDGVTISRAAQRNTVTGTLGVAPSVIAFNRGHGIRISSGSTRNSFLGNSVFRNVGGGITLEAPQAGEEGSNHLQIAPTITSVQVTYDPTLRLSSIVIEGRLVSRSGLFWLEFFANNRSDVPQGRVFVGSGQPALDAAGGFRQSFSLAGDYRQSRFTGTATNTTTSDTSAFSRAFPPL
jgi:Right handed beta helix region